MKHLAPDTPVVILSVGAKVLLLELVADDCVTKPFSPRALLAGAQAAIRTFGDVQVDFARNGRQVIVIGHEFNLLCIILDNPERVLSREELLNDVLGL